MSEMKIEITKRRCKVGGPGRPGYGEASVRADGYRRRGPYPDDRGAGAPGE